MKIKIKIWFKNGTYAEVVEESDKNANNSAVWVLKIDVASTFRIGGLVANKEEIAAIQFVDCAEEEQDDD